MNAPLAVTRLVVYPESDGSPMCDNTRQMEWIFSLVGNLRILFADREDVFVGGNQFWYPVEGDAQTRVAPDCYVVFGRPKGYRGSYRQWEEGDTPLTVVFEVLSPANTVWEMCDKLAFYDEYGADEYYLYDPETNHLSGYVRQGTALRRVRGIEGFVSPRLGIRFDLSGPELVVRYPDGRPFLSHEQLDAARREEQSRREMVERERDAERQRAEAERQRAEAVERERDAERQRAEDAERRAAALEERLRRMGIEPPP